MMYKGYRIEWERGHIKVTSPTGEIWREDTIEDAEREIDERTCVAYWRGQCK